MQQQQNKQHRLSRSLGLFTIVVLLFVALRFDQIQDFVRLYGYRPPAAVASLAAQTGMTPKAQHLFYLNKPGLYDQVGTFRQACPESSEAIVLGCYIGAQRGINIYQISDPTLDGVQQTTAAHEMLHAAYDRLDNKSRVNIDRMLQNYYNHNLKDESVKAEIEIYKKSEPDQLLNEMHSLFGTEVAALPSELEKYYQQYFTNRQQMIGFYAKYQSQFTQRQQVLKDDDIALANQKSLIDSEQANLQQRRGKITIDRARINSYAANNDIAAYNASVPAYNAEVNGYNAFVQQLSTHIDSYNNLVAERNAVASQLASLDKALDTRTAQTVKL